MKIKAILIASALLLSGAAFAQETNVDANGKLQYGPYETNKFWDNWFIDAGAGVNATMSGVREMLKHGKAAGYYAGGVTVDLSVGKWFTPCWGARIGWTGINAGDIKTHKWSQYTSNLVRMDAMMNASHLFAGYKQYRAVNVVPYLSAGYLWNRSWVAGFGCMLNIRLGNVVSLVPDFRCMTGLGYAYGLSPMIRSYQLSATLGLRFNLGKSTWTRKSTSAAVAAAALATATAANSELQARNSQLAAEAAAAAKAKAQLSKENKDLQDELARAKAAKNNIDLGETPIFAYFEIGKATLSEKELAHLDYNVKTAIAQNNNVQLTITGNADKKTGTKKINAKLAQKRADYLYKLLTEKYGLDAKNFTVKSNGGTDIYPTPALNRVAVVSK